MKKMKNKEGDLDRKNITTDNVNTNNRSIGAYICKCGDKFQTLYQFNGHQNHCICRDEETIETPDNNKRFVCPLCSQSFKYATGLLKHEERHKPPGGFLCHICHEPFTTDNQRIYHREKMHRVFSCNYCHSKFQSGNEYADHVEGVHGENIRDYFICPDCGRQFRKQIQLKNHNLSKCGTIKSYSCDDCEAKFLTQNTLNVHKLIHQGEKKHLCNYCGRSFLSKGQLKVHERSHTKEQPFKCYECGKSFSHRESLVTHSSIHTGIKPYFCEGCGNRFSCCSNLLKHRRSRPDTCGQYKKTVRIAPRASSVTSKKKSSATQSTIESTPTIKNEDLNPNDSASGSFSNLNTATPFTEILIPVDETDLDIPEKKFKPQIPEVDESIATTTTSQESMYEMQIPIKTDYEENESSDNIEIIEYYNYITPENEEYNNTAEWVSVENDQVISSPNFQLTVSTETNNIKSPEYNAVEFKEYEEFLDEAGTSEIDEKHIDQGDEPNNENETIENQTELNPDVGESNSDSDYKPLAEIKKSPIKKEKRKTSILSAVKKLPNSELYSCSECPKKYQLQRSLIHHVANFHGNKIAASDNNDNFNESSQEKTKCKFCEKRYNNRLSLEKHQRLHGEDGSLIHRCPCCPTYFETLATLDRHKYDNHTDQLKCDLCNKMYNTRDLVTAHIRYAHRGRKHKTYQFMCTVCGKYFKSKTALDDHEKSKCGQSPAYKCDICGKCVHSAGSLKIHRTMHTGEKPFQCNYCEMAFRTQGQVKVHERKHNGEKPFKCEFCPKSFGHRETLLTHRSLHTGVKRFMCVGCGSRFSCISNLQAHRRSHKTTCGQLPNCTKEMRQWD